VQSVKLYFKCVESLAQSGVFDIVVKRVVRSLISFVFKYNFWCVDTVMTTSSERRNLVVIAVETSRCCRVQCVRL